jgi:RNA polymerase sigma-70 factor (ECF subfamily)
MINDAMDDRAIITRCLEGDTEAFETMVKRYQQPVLAMCWSVLRDREEARDITQEAFVSAFFHLDRYDMRRSFKNWIQAIAYHKCLDKLRKQSSFRRYLKKNRREDWLVDPDGSPESVSGFSEEFKAILDKLKERERIALLLKVRDGFTAAEIGEIIDCSESTVRVYLFHARNKLKKWIKETHRV